MDRTSTDDAPLDIVCSTLWDLYATMLVLRQLTLTAERRHSLRLLTSNRAHYYWAASTQFEGAPMREIFLLWSLVRMYAWQFSAGYCPHGELWRR